MRLKVLNDHLLDVFVSPMELRDGHESRNPFVPRLTDSNEQPRSEGDPETTRTSRHLDPKSWTFVGSPVMGHARAAEPLARILQHQTQAYIDLSEATHCIDVQNPGVGMG
jgi:hypothetical protein